MDPGKKEQGSVAECRLRAANARLVRLLAEETALADGRAAEIRRLVVELTQVVERERGRLRDLLHDDVQQILAAARLRVRTLNAYTTNAATRFQAAEAMALLDQALAVTHDLAADVCPPVVTRHGLAAGLTWLADWMARQHRLSVRARVRPEADPPAEETRMLLFQVVRELLFNTVKHAETQQSVVWQRRTSPITAVILVADRGRGFDASAAPTGAGLWFARQRVEAVGGRLDLASIPGRGTRAAVHYLLT
jgi:signal transduction histidine kinase